MHIFLFFYILHVSILPQMTSQQVNSELYHLFKSHMIHGPCGVANKSSPCTKNGKCTWYYPKKFQDVTIVDQDGYLVHRRRDHGNTIENVGVTIDNRSVVPYNPMLLLKYQEHINMEWCNQCTSIKYLFKCINKVYNWITVVIVLDEGQSTCQQAANEEIKKYVNDRYISPSKACWRILFFPIHSRKLEVERLFFHLPIEQVMYFNDAELVDDILSKPSVNQSMFASWLDANKTYAETRSLTYGQFISKFIFVKSRRCWKPIKQGYIIGRLMWVPPSTGELYYLILMLIVAKGTCTYEDIRANYLWQYSFQTPWINHNMFGQIHGNGYQMTFCTNKGNWAICKVQNLQIA